MKRVFTIALLVAILAPCAAFAQVDRATLTGTIKDTVGALVPGARVTITNQATNSVQHQETTDTGEYLFVSLIPGKYQIDVELSGFKKNSQIVTLEVGQRARVDAVLEVGAVTESVQVTETAHLLNANDATLGAVIPQTQVATRRTCATCSSRFRRSRPA